jgi:hypothetical protein
MKSLSFAAVAFGTVLLLSPVIAQQSATQGDHQHGQAAAQQMPGMMDHNKMIEEMKATDARLQMLAERMKSAKGDKKIEAIESVVSELVTSEIDRHQQMIRMHQHMMSETPNK